MPICKGSTSQTRGVSTINNKFLACAVFYTPITLLQFANKPSVGR